MAMYPYITLPDETLITHSHLLEKNGVKTVKVHFERPKPFGFDSATCLLPSHEWIMRDGYSDEEIARFEQLLHNAAHSFFKYAEIGGLDIAKDLKYYMGLNYRVEVIKDTEEGGYALHCPELPGCMTCADTLKNGYTMLEDAKKSWFTACLEDGVPIPEPSNLESR